MPAGVRSRWCVRRPVGSVASTRPRRRSARWVVSCPSVHAAPPKRLPARHWIGSTCVLRDRSSGVGRRGRARAEGRQDPVSRAGERLLHRGRDAVPGRDECRAERRGDELGQPGPPARELREGRAHRPRLAQLRRPPTGPVGRRRLVVAVRVAVLEHAEARRRRADPRGDRRLEPGRHHGQREGHSVSGRQGEQPIEGRARRARVVVAPPDRRGSGRPSVELRREAVPRGGIPRLRHGRPGAAGTRAGPARGVPMSRRVCSEGPR